MIPEFPSLPQGEELAEEGTKRIAGLETHGPRPEHSLLLHPSLCMCCSERNMNTRHQCTCVQGHHLILAAKWHHPAPTTPHVPVQSRETRRSTPLCGGPKNAMSPLASPPTYMYKSSLLSACPTSDGRNLESQMQALLPLRMQDNLEGVVVVQGPQEAPCSLAPHQ